MDMIKAIVSLAEFGGQGTSSAFSNVDKVEANVSVCEKRPRGIHL
jgi:hypothetical protein